MCRPIKISGTIEPLWGEHGQAFIFGDITHHNDIRFDEMPCVPVLPRTMYRLDFGETIKIPETTKYYEEKNNGKSS